MYLKNIFLGYFLTYLFLNRRVFLTHGSGSGSATLASEYSRSVGITGIPFCESFSIVFSTDLLISSPGGDAIFPTWSTAGAGDRFREFMAIFCTPNIDPVLVAIHVSDPHPPWNEVIEKIEICHTF
jgi:hypothetical protein